MYAKQYEITLPADYDMRIIRRRVADFGYALDDRAGLGLKAYLIRERGVAGSPVNQYAPLYLWKDIGAMGHFLAGGAGFQNIIRDFGRPAVRHWMGVAAVAGPARAVAPKAASRRLTLLPADADSDGPGEVSRVEREIEQLDELARREGVHTAALALDPRHWQLLRFVLWQDAVPRDADATERYEVLHLSAPHLSDLPHGRNW
jgi:hypothetical protein